MTTSDLRILSTVEINEALSKLDDWELEDNGRAIMKRFEFPDFNEAIKFVNKVAEIAEQEGHHPDLRLYSFNKLEIKFTTHTVDGLTKKDFEVALRVDKSSNLN